mgnify:CR=1 FL=1
MLDLAEELRKTEIKVRAMNALEQFNESIGTIFHLLNRGEIDQNEETFWEFKDWDFDSSQKLPPALEAARAAAEKQINQELQQKFGNIPEATVYFVSNDVMESHDFYW